MPFSLTGIKTAITHLFGVEETKAHHLVEAVRADLTPVLTQAEEQLHGLITEGHNDLEALLTKGLADIRADLAEIKAALGSAPAPAPGPKPAA
ncbi:MAG: hypothetical protein HOW97_09535 [Catenulispora sp.]|nr:hypothetical protein [Catenulispora sp.]